MKISNRILLSLICLIVALVLPMLQVQATEDTANTGQEQTVYVVSQKQYENGELIKDDTYYFQPASNVEDIFFVQFPLSDGFTLFSLRYWDPVGLVSRPLVVTFDSYVRSNLPPYEEKDFSNLRNPSVSLMSGSSSNNGNVVSYSCDPGSLMVFSDNDAAKAFFIDGDDSGWINKPIYGPDITDARFYDPDCFLVNPTMDYTKGTSALSGTLSTFMGIKLNNDFYSYSSRNMKYTFLWDYVNTSFETDLSSSYMHIDIICNDQVYFFSDLDCLSSGNVEITLQDILSFLKENGVQPVIESFSIRYTPFYEIGLKTYYGRSVRFFVKANSSGVLSESQGNDLYGSNSDYSDSDIVSPSDLPVTIPGFTDDESFEFDFSYDSENMFKNFFNSLKSLISYCGQIPFLVNKVFSFLPDAYGKMIVIILAACFIMRLLGR